MNEVHYLPPDGYDGYEGGAPYWFLPNDQKTYDMAEAVKAYNEYFKNRK